MENRVSRVWRVAAAFTGLILSASVAAAQDLDPIGALLDQEELVGFSYRLEVCSPGLSRPLKHGRQLAKAVGRKVRVRWQSAEADMTRQRAAEGRLLSADDNHLHLETEAGPLALERSTVDDIVYKLDW